MIACNSSSPSVRIFQRDWLDSRRHNLPFHKLAQHQDNEATGRSNSLDRAWQQNEEEWERILCFSLKIQKGIQKFLT